MSIKIFISYSHADRSYREKLVKHFAPPERSGKVSLWWDQKIPPGADWEKQIRMHLDTADVILLLVSAEFIASQYCWDREVCPALERHKAGTARVLPIILKMVGWQETPLGQLQALPTGAKPINQWADPDAAFEDVVKGILKVPGNKHLHG